MITFAGGKSNVASYKDGPSEDAKFSNDYQSNLISSTDVGGSSGLENRGQTIAKMQMRSNINLHAQVPHHLQLRTVNSSALCLCSISEIVTCDVCKQEVQNLPVTLFKISNPQTDVSVIVLVSMLAYFCFHEELLEAKESIDVCEDDKVTNYLNRSDVQEELHAKLVGVRKWDVCSK
ncbi:hypothetical protein JHK87_055211 [Glycine soja]|nr:hypothetical protein JHK87_055211 [Glycine soja]